MGERSTGGSFSTEEADLLLRSKKKVKMAGISSPLRADAGG